MFTGIIPVTGRVVKAGNTKRGRFIAVKVDSDGVRKVPEGGSISIDGVCLTRIPFRHPEERSDEGSRTNVRSSYAREILRFAQNDKSFLQFELMDSTLKLTTLGTLENGDRVNVEPALRAFDMVDGHFISGHVDGVGRVKSVRMRGRTRYVVFTTPQHLRQYVVPQGSIAVNGVSLTVVDAGDSCFSVALTQYTAEHTNLGTLVVGKTVNIEVDMFAKYIFNFLNHYGSGKKISHRCGQV